MNARRVLLIGAGLLTISALIPSAHSAEGVAQNGRPVMITRFFTGPDGLTHAEEIEVKFAPGGGAYNLLANSGAQLRRTPPGRENDYHTASRRQYVITLSGHGEVEVAGGKKISMGPGHIDLVEDTTGKGHITKVVGAEDRVTLQLPLADQSGR